MKAVKTVSREFLEWWVDELRTLIPERLHRVLYRKKSRLVFCVVGEQIEIFKNSGTQCDKESERIIVRRDHSEEIAEKLNVVSISQRLSSICLRMSSSDCLLRDRKYPRAAKPKISEILQRELLQSTPFTKDEIYSDYVTTFDHHEPSMMNVTQLIIKREIVDQLVEDLQAANLIVDHVDAYDEKTQKIYDIDFFKDDCARKENKASIFSNYVFFFVLIILLLIFAAIGMVQRQESVLVALSTEIAYMKRDAMSITKKNERISERSDQITSVLLEKSQRPSILQVWREITVLLPDSVWLTDLQFNGKKVLVTGFATSAASLVEVLNESPLFKETKLVSQVRYDEQKKKEQFRLEIVLQMRQPENSNSSAAGEM